MSTSITGGAAQKAKKKLDDLKKDWAAQGNAGDFDLKLGSQEDYDKLVVAVQEATKKNENIAALRSRIQALGKSVVGLATKLGVI